MKLKIAPVVRLTTSLSLSPPPPDVAMDNSPFQSAIGTQMATLVAGYVKSPKSLDGSTLTTTHSEQLVFFTLEPPINVPIFSAVPSSTRTKLENLGSTNSATTILFTTPSQQNLFTTPSQQKVIKGEIQANLFQILSA